MKVRVLLFAALREKAGQGEVDLDLEPGTPVSEVPKILFPTDLLPSRLRYAVNQDYVQAGKTLVEGDEVALIPPVAGG